MDLVQPLGDSPNLPRLYLALGAFLLAGAVTLITHAALRVCPCGTSHR